MRKESPPPNPSTHLRGLDRIGKNRCPGIKAKRRTIDRVRDNLVCQSLAKVFRASDHKNMRTYIQYIIL